MTAVIGLPVALLAIALIFWPGAAWFAWLPVPLAAVLALLVAGLGCILTRQTRWLFALAVLATHLFLVHQALFGAVTLGQAASMVQFLPILSLLWLLVLALRTPPAIASLAGLAWLLVLLGSLGLFWLPWVASAANEAGLLSNPMQRVVSGIHLTWLHVFAAAALSVVWLALIVERRGDVVVRTHAMLSALILILAAFIDQPRVIGWVALVAAGVVVLGLAFQLVHLAYIDDLTGLLQRRALNARLERLGRKAAVVMLDVDHFKAFNDQWGHDVGDQVLRLLGHLLHSEKGLQAFRYGGEEFTLVFSHAHRERIERQLEALRERVSGYPLVVRESGRPEDDRRGRQDRGNSGNENTLSVTISLGWTVRRHDDTPDAIIKRADEALYKAKNAGRNRVCFIE